MTLLQNYNLKSHNTFRLGSIAKNFLKYNTTQELIHFLNYRDKRLKLIPLGGGSDILLTRKFYTGYFIQSNICDITIVKENAQYQWLKVGSGLAWDDFVKYTLKQGLSGLENLSYIPGSVGGSTVQNVGAYGTEASDFIEEVEAICISDGSIKRFTNSQCQFSYHSSVFANIETHKYAITHVTYRLSRNFTPIIQYEALRNYVTNSKLAVTAEMMRNEVIRIRRTKLPDPRHIGNAGSFFSNPVISSEKLDSILSQYPDMPHYLHTEGFKIPAGWLIQHSGSGIYKYGCAAVYDKNALVIINQGNATATHILRLSKKIQKQVWKIFGIQLHPEVIHI